jgi:hypothetical protein
VGRDDPGKRAGRARLIGKAVGGRIAEFDNLSFILFDSDEIASIPGRQREESEPKVVGNPLIGTTSPQTPLRLTYPLPTRLMRRGTVTETGW